MNILLIGDPSGNDDEGMKKIGSKLLSALVTISKTSVQFAAVKEVLVTPAEFRTPDIIHYVAGPSWRSFLYASLLKRRIGSKKTKIVISFIHPHWSRAAELAVRLFRPDAAVVQSSYWNSYCRGLGLPLWDRPIAGVDLTKFRPVSQIDKMRIRDELQLPGNKQIVLHVGHLNRGRNLIALTKLVEKDVLPVVIGSTTVKPDKRLLRHLETSGIVVIRNYIANIEQYYQAADCYVFTTVDSQWCIQIPISVVEALACGLPVVTTRFEGLPLYFPEGYPGITYIDDLTILSTKVHAALSSLQKPDPEDLEFFDWAIIAAGLHEFYAKIGNEE